MLEEVLNKKDHWTYRFNIDDNIIFLVDLANHKYASLFDQPYLGFWREMHEKYGAKIQFNLHGKRGDFHIGQLTDEYKDQWEENASWIRLSFHQMDDPKSSFSYANVSYDNIKKDYLEVTNHIERFAGESLVSPYTVLHHAACTKAGCEALRDCGVKGLAGATVRWDDGSIDQRYHLSMDQTLQLDKTGIIWDSDVDMYFFKFDISMHRTSLRIEEIQKKVENVLSDEPHWWHMEFTFEEYSLDPNDPEYIPDGKKKVEHLFSLMNERKIPSAFLEEFI